MPTLNSLALNAYAGTEVIVYFKTTPAAREGLRVLHATTRSATALGSLAALDQAVSLEPLFATGTRTPATGRRFSLAAGIGTAEAPPDELAGLHVVRYADATLAKNAAAELTADGRVKYAHVIPPRYAFAPTGKPKKKKAKKKTASGVDPMLNRQWGLTAVQLAQAQALASFQEATNVLVAVIDSGCDNSHPDLAGVLAEQLDFTQTQLDDKSGHGTHVTGIIAALRNNNIGISGVTQCRNIMSLKALDPYDGPGYYKAIQHAKNKGAKVANFSLGGGHDPTEELLIKQAITSGVVIVAAMGNDALNGNPTSYPAAIDGVIAVGATDEMDRRASFSQHGPHITLVAPGESILSTVPTYPSSLASTTDYDSWPGTSMATPFVTGAVALMFAKKPTATVAEITTALKSGVDLCPGQTGFTNELGHGRLNIKKALQAL